MIDMVVNEVGAVHVGLAETLTRLSRRHAGHQLDDIFAVGVVCVLFEASG